MTTETIKVEGMSCDHCKHAVESALTNDYDDNKVSMTNMKEAIEDQGYDAK